MSSKGFIKFLSQCFAKIARSFIINNKTTAARVQIPRSSILIVTLITNSSLLLLRFLTLLYTIGNCLSIGFLKFFEIFFLEGFYYCEFSSHRPGATSQIEEAPEGAFKLLIHKHPTSNKIHKICF